MPREDPKKETSPIKDMMLPKAKKVMVQWFATEETRRWDSWRCIIVTEETSQEQGKEKGFQDSEVPGQTLCLPPRKSEDQPELFSDF